MLNETFTTHITFTSGDSHKEEPITGDKLVSTITRLVRGPAAMAGLIKEVKIVDQNGLHRLLSTRQQSGVSATKIEHLCTKESLP